MKWSLDSEQNRDGSIFARILIDGAPTGMVSCNTAELAHLRTTLGLDPEAVAALEEERDSLACDLAEHRASVAELLGKVKALEERAVAAEAREEGLLRRIDQVEDEARSARARAYDQVEKNRLAGVALRALAAQVEASVAAEEARGAGGVMTREECTAEITTWRTVEACESEELGIDAHRVAAAQHARDVGRLRQVELDGWDLYDVFNGKPAKRRPMKADWIWHQMANAARARFLDALSGPAAPAADEPAPDSNPPWLDQNDPCGSFARNVDQVVEATSEAHEAVEHARGQS